FPKFTEALEAVLYIALNSGKGAVSGKSICAYQNVMPRHLEPVMQALVKEGILKGTKGPRGGYTLAKEKRKTTAREIFAAIVKTQENQGGTTQLRRDISEKIDQGIMSAILGHLSNTTIEDLCKQMETKAAEKPEFDI